MGRTRVEAPTMTLRHSCLWGVAALLLLGAAFAARLEKAKDADDWPTYRNDAAQTGLAAGKLPDKLDVLWKVETGDSIEGAAAVRDGVVYFASLDEHLYAVGLDDGKE